jgi:hypothetical protein
VAITPRGSPQRPTRSPSRSNIDSYLGLSPSGPIVPSAAPRTVDPGNRPMNGGWSRTLTVGASGS